jgi:hypothetical protein
MPHPGPTPAQRPFSAAGRPRALADATTSANPGREEPAGLNAPVNTETTRDHGAARRFLPADASPASHVTSLTVDHGGIMLDTTSARRGGLAVVPTQSAAGLGVVSAKAAGSGVAGSAGVVAGIALLLPMEAGVPVPVPADLVMLAVGARVGAGDIPLAVAILAFETVAIPGTTALFLAARGPGHAVVRRLGPRLGLTMAARFHELGCKRTCVLHTPAGDLQPAGVIPANPDTGLARFRVKAAVKARHPSRDEPMTEPLTLLFYPPAGDGWPDVRDDDEPAGMFTGLTAEQVIAEVVRWM